MEYGLEGKSLYAVPANRGFFIWSSWQTQSRHMLRVSHDRDRLKQRCSPTHPRIHFSFGFCWLSRLPPCLLQLHSYHHGKGPYIQFLNRIWSYSWQFFGFGNGFRPTLQTPNMGHTITTSRRNWLERLHTFLGPAALTPFLHISSTFMQDRKEGATNCIPRQR